MRRTRREFGVEESDAHVSRLQGWGEICAIIFVDGGKDTQFCAGHYGSKMAAADVHVEFTQ